MFLADDLTTQVGTFALLPQIVRAVQVPVIAAGGIADARGVAAALALGAAGGAGRHGLPAVPRGDDERGASRRAEERRRARHTALTNVFTGRPARGIVNRLMRELGPMSAAAPGLSARHRRDRAAARRRPRAAGSGDFSPLWSGQNATGCKPVPAAELTRELAAGFGAVPNSAPTAADDPLVAGGGLVAALLEIRKVFLRCSLLGAPSRRSRRPRDGAELGTP